MSEQDPTPRAIAAWEEPPPPITDRRNPWRGVIRELRANPGQWARLEERVSAAAATHLAQSISSGRQVSFRPRGSFEARYKDNCVWVRFVGYHPG